MRPPRIGGQAGAAWARHVTEILQGRPNVTLLSRTTAFGYFSHNFVALCERLQDHLSEPSAQRPRERLWQVRAREVIFATGALERPLIFPGNDRPGVLLAGAGTQLPESLWRADRPSRRASSPAHDAAYQTALDLHAAGATSRRSSTYAPQPAASCRRRRGGGTDDSRGHDESPARAAACGSGRSRSRSPGMAVRSRAPRAESPAMRC